MSIGLSRLFDRAVQEKVVSLDAMRKAKQQAAQNLETMPSIAQRVAEGRDPMHAIYTNTLNLLSLFGEEMTTLPPLHKMHDFLSKWQDIYQPSFPPRSPVTKSYFACWTLLDAAFGADKETLCSCFLALADRLDLDPLQLQAARNLDQSRMGLYEVIQGKGQFVDLRELITGQKLTAYCPSGYEGIAGHIVWIRLAPPLANTLDYWVALTTPYRLVLQTTADWLAYFARQGILPGTVGVDARLHRHMKYGKTPTYWSEYVFYGYSNYAADVVLLTGFPDQPQTQPAHAKYRH